MITIIGIKFLLVKILILKFLRHNYWSFDDLKKKVSLSGLSYGQLRKSDGEKDDVIDQFLQHLYNH